MEFTSLLGYSLALVVAIGLLGLILGEKDNTPAATHIFTYELLPYEGEGPELTLTSAGNDEVIIRRTAVPVRKGESVAVVATFIKDKITMTEKLVANSTGEETLCNAEARVTFIPARRFALRYESTISGQWTTMSVLNVEGNVTKSELRL